MPYRLLFIRPADHLIASEEIHDLGYTIPLAFTYPYTEGQKRAHLLTSTNSWSPIKMKLVCEAKKDPYWFIVIPVKKSAGEYIYCIDGNYYPDHRATIVTSKDDSDHGGNSVFITSDAIEVYKPSKPAPYVSLDKAGLIADKMEWLASRPDLTFPFFASSKDELKRTGHCTFEDAIIKLRSQDHAPSHDEILNLFVYHPEKKTYSINCFRMPLLAGILTGIISLDQIALFYHQLKFVFSGDWYNALTQGEASELKEYEIPSRGTACFVDGIKHVSLFTGRKSEDGSQEVVQYLVMEESSACSVTYSSITKMRSSLSSHEITIAPALGTRLA